MINGGMIQEFDPQLEKIRFGAHNQTLKDSLVHRQGYESPAGNVVMIRGDQAIVMLQPKLLLLLLTLPLQRPLRRRGRIRGGG